ncbi:DUF6056 family protein [Robertmurraya sp.]|uniref:DUF6056 family protein n=1 Tax=Robertmurraya sp. TaxID=2837525 RepID=UPI003703D9F7
MNRLIKSREDKYYVISFMAIFSFYLYLAYSTPLTGDDWFWGSDNGLKELEDWFSGYNGRYLGNLTVIVLTRIEWLKLALIPLFSTLIVILMINSSKKRDSFYLTLSLILILFIPTNIYSQTYAWVSGFSNYVTSIALVLIYTSVIKNVFESDEPMYNKWQTFFVIPLGLGTQLFVEHITLYVLFLSIFIICFSFYKFKRVYPLHVLYLCSSIIGAIIMFSNSAYSTIVGGNDDYRSLNSNTYNFITFIKVIYSVYKNQVYPIFISNSIVLIIVLSFLCKILIFRSLKKENKIKNYVYIVLLSIVLFYPIYAILINLSILYKSIPSDVSIIFSVCYFVSVAFVILLTVDVTKYKYHILFYYFSAWLIICPLFFVNPIGPRNFIAPYIFLIVAILIIFQYLEVHKLLEKKFVKTFLSLSLILVSISYIFTFSSIRYSDNLRMKEVIDQVKDNKSEIILRKLPHDHYLWMSSPEEEGFHSEAFKQYYGIPKDTRLITTP